MDGRIQLPVAEYIKNKYKVDYVDEITEAGPNKILSENKDAQKINNIRARVDISINGHGSKLIAIVGHYDCAGNLSPKEEQLKHLQKAGQIVGEWSPNVKIIALWVNANWQVEEI